MNWLCGFCFCVGLCLTASDGKWFPWINFIGLVIFAFAGWLAEKIEERKYKNRYKQIP